MGKYAKRALGLFLAIVISLGVCAGALAAEYKTYGDGSVKSFVLTDANGYTKTYFDIYDGATTRNDTSDAPVFLRKALSAENSAARYTQSQGYLWNNLAKHIAANEKSLFGKKSFSELVELVQSFDNHGAIGNSTLIEADGLKGVESGIRKTLSANLNAANSKFSTTPDMFMTNKELSESTVGGVAFYTQTGYWGSLNASILDKMPMAAAYGVIFYDFKLSFVNTPDALESAVGKETDIKKLEGKPGFTHTTGAGTDNYTYKLTNDTPDSVTQTQQMTKGSTLTTGSTVSSTKTYSFSEMIGLDVKMGFKLPFIGSSEQTFKTSFTAGQTIGSTESSSLTKSEQLSVASSVQVKLPPYTCGVVEQVNTVDAVTIEYDYPVAVSYKTAVYALFYFGDKKDQNTKVIAKFGRDGDAKNVIAADNLYNRFRFRDTPGYEDSHGDGLDWKAIIAGDADKKDLIAAISEYVPMSVTGGTISYSADCVEGRANKPVPLYPLTRVVLTGDDYRDMNPGDKLNVASFKIAGFCDKAKTIPYSDFSAENGHWRLVDEALQPIEQSDIASLAVNPLTGRTVLTAGAKAGTVYLQYLIDEDCYTYADNMGGYTKNADLDATALIEICVSESMNDFAGTIEAAGEVTGRAGTSVDLNDADFVKITVKDAQGNVIAPKYPITWTVPENTVGISVEANQLDLIQAGKYSIVAFYQDAASNPLTVTVTDGDIPVCGISLSADERTLEVGEKGRLTASVEPQNATDKTVVWSSEDASVATVDQTGLITAVKEGSSVIMAVSNDGRFSAACVVTVGSSAPYAKLKPFIEKLALKKGASFKLTAPAGLVGSWSVADPSIAAITDKGAVKAKKTGETTLTFTVGAAKGAIEFLGKSLVVGDSVTIPLVVRDKGFVVTKLTVDPAKPIVGVDGKIALDVALKPAKAVDREVYYRSDDESVAVVDKSGCVRGVSVGTAKITAVSPSGAFKTVTVTVSGSVEKITLDRAKASVKKGDKLQLALKEYQPSPLPAPALTWESSKKGVATVDADGVVTALKKGKTTITATAASGAKAICKVTVK